LVVPADRSAGAPSTFTKLLATDLAKGRELRLRSANRRPLFLSVVAEFVLVKSATEALGVFAPFGASTPMGAQSFSAGTVCPRQFGRRFDGARELGTHPLVKVLFGV
jgi:hypothetical protein